MDAEQQQTQTDRWTVGKLLKWIDEFLARGGVDEPLLSAQILLGHVLDCSRIELYARFDQQPGEDQLAGLREIVKQAAAGKPIAYLVGHKEFFSINFKVSPAVLIPRTETETLVEWIIRRARQEDLAGQDLKILDLCTGSGCIAVALARFLPSLQCVVAVDVSADALEVAGQNCRAAKVAQKVSLLAGDLFEAIEPCQQFDFIVSNPPYVSDAQWRELPGGISDYEPALALRGGSDGLDLIRRIIDQGIKHLSSDGYLVLEVGYDQADQVKQLYKQAGFVAVGQESDYAGIQRVVWGTIAAREG